MNNHEWPNPFLVDSYDGKVLTVDDMRLELACIKSEHPTYLGEVVCSREFYERPAFTVDLEATRESTVNALKIAMELGGQGWRGGSYKFYPDSKMYLTSKWGVPGVPLTMSVLAAYWMGVNETLKRLSK